MQFSIIPRVPFLGEERSYLSAWDTVNVFQQGNIQKKEKIQSNDSGTEMIHL